MAINKPINFSEIQKTFRPAKQNSEEKLGDYHSTMAYHNRLHRVVKLPPPVYNAERKKVGAPISMGQFNHLSKYNDIPVDAPDIRVLAQPGDQNYYKNTGILELSRFTVLITLPNNPGLPFPVEVGVHKFEIKKTAGSNQHGYRAVNSNLISGGAASGGKYILTENKNADIHAYGTYRYRVTTQTLGPADPTSVDEPRENWVVLSANVVESEPFTLTRLTAGAPSDLGLTISRYVGAVHSDEGYFERQASILNYVPDGDTPDRHPTPWITFPVSARYTNYSERAPQGWSTDDSLPTVQNITGYKKSVGTAYNTPGAILSVTITDPGRAILGYGNGLGWAPHFDNDTGGGADFNLKISGGQLAQVSILSPGRGYRVGDVFQVQSASFGGQLYAYFEVTSVGSGSANNYTTVPTQELVEPDFGPSLDHYNYVSAKIPQQFSSSLEVGKYLYYVVMVMGKEYTNPDGATETVTQTLTSLVTTVNVTYTEIREGEGAITDFSILNETVDEAINFGVTATARFSLAFQNARGLNFYVQIPHNQAQYLDMDNSDIGDHAVPNSGKFVGKLEIKKHNKYGLPGTINLSVGYKYDSQEGTFDENGKERYWPGYYDAVGNRVQRLGSQGNYDTKNIAVKDSKPTTDFGLSGKNKIDEGNNFTYLLSGSNLPPNQQSWNWSTTFPDAAISGANSGEITLTYPSGNQSRGSYGGKLVIGTTVREDHYEDVTGRIQIRNDNNVLKSQTGVLTIKNTHEDVTDPTGGNNIQAFNTTNKNVISAINELISVSVVLNADGSVSISGNPNNVSGSRRYMSGDLQGDWTVRFKPNTINTLMADTSQEDVIGNWEGERGIYGEYSYSYSRDYRPRGEVFFSANALGNRFSIFTTIEGALNIGTFHTVTCDYEFYNTTTKAIVAGGTATLNTDSMHLLGSGFDPTLNPGAETTGTTYDSYNDDEHVFTVAGTLIDGEGVPVDVLEGLDVTVDTGLVIVEPENFVGIGIGVNVDPADLVIPDVSDLGVVGGIDLSGYTAAVAGLDSSGWSLNIDPNLLDTVTSPDILNTQSTNNSAVFTSGSALDQAEAAAANLTPAQLSAIEAVANNFTRQGSTETYSPYFNVEPAGTLKRTYCGTGLGGVFNVKHSNYGVYADGVGGEYIKLLESNSPGCGYVAPAVIVPNAVTIDFAGVNTRIDLAEAEAAGLDVTETQTFTPSVAIADTASVTPIPNLNIPASVYVSPTTVTTQATIETDKYDDVVLPNFDQSTSTITPTIDIDLEAINEALKNINVGNIFQSIGL